MYSFPHLESVYCSISSSNYCFLTCIQISQEAGQVVWFSYLLKNFPQFVVIDAVKGFDIVNEADVFLKLCAFLMIQQMLAIWSLVPGPFLNPAWTSGSSWFIYCWSLAWRILSITLLVCVYVCVQLLSCAWLFATLWTVAHQAPLSTRFSRQEYWIGLPFPTPGVVCEMSAMWDGCNCMVVLSILWHCLSLVLKWKLTFSSPVATAQFSKFADILSAALSQHHLVGFDIAQLEFHHLH